MKRFAVLFALASACSSAPAIAQEASKVHAEGLSAQIVGPAFYVSDMERSLKFYRDVLGMTVRIRFGPAGKQDVLVGFGMDMTKTSLMLLSDKEARPRKIGHVHGFDRIALMVSDLPGIQARLAAAGFKPGEIRTVHGTSSMMMVEDPDGYRIELIDTKPAKK